MKAIYYLIILILVSAFVEFYGLGRQDVGEYDEARFAVNAYEMMQNGDYINLHYQGSPDTWVARPPLKAYLIIGGYKLFGFNEWGLRFSSGVSVVLFIVFAFLFFKEFFPDGYAFLGGLMLIFSKGIIGFHIGRTGDMDAELILFLAVISYTFIRYLNGNSIINIYITALFLGLTFYLKTTACFIYLPGFVLFLACTGKLKAVLASRHIWAGICLFLFCILSWFIILQLKGATYATDKPSYHQNSNSWQTMILYDTWQRFTASNFDGHPVEKNYLFVPLCLDSVFTPWNYIFYGGIAYFIYLQLNKQRQHMLKTLKAYPGLLMSIAVLIPIVILLTFGMHKLDWYISPALLYTTIPAIFLLQSLFKKNHWTVYICAAGFIVICYFRFQRIQKDSLKPNEVSVLKTNSSSWNAYSTVRSKYDIPQNIYAYLLWNNKKVIFEDSLTKVPGQLYLIDSDTADFVFDTFQPILRIDKMNEPKTLTLGVLK